MTEITDKIDWHEVGNALRMRVEMMTLGEQFRFWARMYAGVEYVGNRENFVRSSDCSGTVCGPLWMMGYNIRCHADALFRNIFTEEVTDFDNREDIMAVFYATGEARHHMDREVAAGYITHVAPVVGRYVLCNAVDPIDLHTSKAVYESFTNRGYDVHWRRINMTKLKMHSDARDLAWGVDPILERMFRH